MPHFRVDDALHSHPKARHAGLEAMGLWNMCGSYCMGYLTDGFVPEWYVKSWPKGAALAKRLVAAKLWIPAVNEDGEKGWQFHEFTGPGRNDSRSMVEASRKKWRDKKAGQRADSPPVSPGDNPGDGRSANAEIGPRISGTKGATNAVQGVLQSPIIGTHSGRYEIAVRRNRNALTTEGIEMSPGDITGDTPRDSLHVTRDPTQPNEKEHSPTDESALNVDPPRADLSPPVDRSASRLVHEIIGTNSGYSNAVLAKLRIRASEIFLELGAEIAAETLRIWKTKPHLGPDALSALTAEATKTVHYRNHPGAAVNGHDAKVNDFLAYANTPQRLEIEQ